MRFREQFTVERRHFCGRYSGKVRKSSGGRRKKEKMRLYHISLTTFYRILYAEPSAHTHLPFFVCDISEFSPSHFFLHRETRRGLLRRDIMNNHREFIIEAKCSQTTNTANCERGKLQFGICEERVSRLSFENETSNGI